MSCTINDLFGSFSLTAKRRYCFFKVLPWMKSTLGLTVLLVFTNCSSYLFGQERKLEFIGRPVYIVAENYVIYQDREIRKVIHPDMNSFTPIDNSRERRLALDKNGVYFRGEFIRTDTAGFKIVGESQNNYPNYSDLLWKSNKQVFKNMKKVKGADAESFEPIECYNGKYFKDKFSIFYFDQKIKNSDGKTVNRSCNDYCHDKNHVYINGEILSVNGEIAKPVNDLLFKTRDSVYWYRNIGYSQQVDKIEALPDADANSFRKLSLNYAIDANRLYFKQYSKELSTEQISNLVVWDSNYWSCHSDGDSLYLGINRGLRDINIDLTSFGVVAKSGIIYDSAGIYEMDYHIDKPGFVKLPFDYDQAVNEKNISLQSIYLIYSNQAYNLYRDTFHYNLNAQEMRRVKNGQRLLRDSVANSHYRKDYKMFSRTPFEIVEDSLYFQDTALIKAENLELLSVFKGYSAWCGLDTRRSTKIYLIKNTKGYWLIESDLAAKPEYLGEVFYRSWNPKFEDFELPKDHAKARN
jgi:hypothetical protein